MISVHRFATKAVTNQKKQILARAHESLPEAFPPCKTSSIEMVEDIVAIRPLRPDGVRVEQEAIGDQQVVHVYGTTVGGYILSFGLAEEAATLIKAAVYGTRVERMPHLVARCAARAFASAESQTPHRPF